MDSNKQSDVMGSINNLDSLEATSALLSQCLDESIKIETIIPSSFEDALCFKAHDKKIMLMAAYEANDKLREEAFGNLMEFADLHKSSNKTYKMILVLLNLKGKESYCRSMQKMIAYDDEHLTDNTKVVEICVQSYVDKYLRGDESVAKKYPNILALEFSPLKAENTAEDLDLLLDLYQKLNRLKDKVLSSEDETFYEKIVKELLKRDITPLEISNLTGLSLKDIEMYKNK